MRGCQLSILVVCMGKLVMEVKQRGIFIAVWNDVLCAINWTCTPNDCSERVAYNTLLPSFWRLSAGHLQTAQYPERPTRSAGAVLTSQPIIAEGSLLDLQKVDSAG